MKLLRVHGKDARIITKHSGEEVMLNHYIDSEVISKVTKGF